MSRRQIKKRSFGQAAPIVSAAPQASISPTSSKASAIEDPGRYAYVKKDLTQIALILSVILTLYVTIFLSNQALHLF